MYLSQQLVHSDFFLHMRVDVEKTAEQRLATFQESYAKSSFICSNLRFSVLEWTSSLPERWRQNFQDRRGYRNWNYHCMIDFLFFSLKNHDLWKCWCQFLAIPLEWWNLWGRNWWRLLQCFSIRKFTCNVCSSFMHSDRPVQCLRLATLLCSQVVSNDKLTGLVMPLCKICNLLKSKRCIF